jgi:hypothetical protein
VGNDADPTPIIHGLRACTNQGIHISIYDITCYDELYAESVPSCDKNAGITEIVSGECAECLMDKGEKYFSGGHETCGKPGTCRSAIAQNVHRFCAARHASVRVHFFWDGARRWLANVPGGDGKIVHVVAQTCRGIRVRRGGYRGERR